MCDVVDHLDVRVKRCVPIMNSVTVNDLQFTACCSAGVSLQYRVDFVGGFSSTVCVCFQSQSLVLISADADWRQRTGGHTAVKHFLHIHTPMAASQSPSATKTVLY